MHNQDECVLLWTIPSWEAWAAVEQEFSHGRDVLLPDSSAAIRDRMRILLVDAPLSPLRTGRQPTRDDRTDWVD
jgi:hypothetical protein